ncbi:MAG: phosphoribosyltransferase [Acidaminococcaceae bacterium]
MDNILFFSFDSLFDSNKNLYPGMDAILEEYRDNIGVVSHNPSKLSFVETNYKHILHPITRSRIYECIKKLPPDETKLIYIGIHDEDLQVAANTKTCLICCNWSESDPGEKVVKYGIPINNVQQLSDMLNIFFNNHGWYSTQNIDSKTTVFSLMNARSRTGAYHQNEAQLIVEFENLLKHGARNYYHILQYYLLGCISSTKVFNEVQDWGIFPSSGLNLNQEMHDFKESVRFMLNGKKSEPILIRHLQSQKSHYLHKDVRIPCDRHFNTININPYYENKLRNRVVCIFDDYLTNGTSFETTRNLLYKAGIKKLYCISLGTFGNNYVRQNYDISGNIFTPNYNYSLIDNRQTLALPTYNDAAMTDISNIVAILNK